MDDIDRRPVDLLVFLLALVISLLSQGLMVLIQRSYLAYCPVEDACRSLLVQPVQVCTDRYQHVGVLSDAPGVLQEQLWEEWDAASPFLLSCVDPLSVPAVREPENVPQPLPGFL